MKNPALSQELRYEPATVIPLKNKYSLLDWLKAENRLIPREVKEEDSSLNDEDLGDLMDVDDDEDIDDDNDDDIED